jgi:hypothetical protein
MNKGSGALLALLGLACSGDAACLSLPCPQPRALTITVTDAASGAPVTGAVIDVTGRETATAPCSGTCNIAGPAGTYELEISAPGFVSLHRSIQVSGTDPACGCSTAITENVAVALSAAS